ncbi:MAG TPA: hypothetical protein VHO84_02890 [Syntrophorhabdaceae bacterium]|nr:hypothetical protein [Syntrophorhabdaceae bacterium]
MEQTLFLCGRKIKKKQVKGLPSVEHQGTPHQCHQEFSDTTKR